MDCYYKGNMLHLIQFTCFLLLTICYFGIVDLISLSLNSDPLNFFEVILIVRVKVSGMTCYPFIY